MPHHLVHAVLAVAEAATLLAGLAVVTTVSDHNPIPTHVTTQAASRATELADAHPSSIRHPRARPRRTSAVRRTPRVHTAPRHASRRPSAPVAHQASLPPQGQMEQAIARIPGYHPGDAVWFVTSRFHHWGVADLGGAIIYINPDVPPDRMYDVVAHEWSHVLSVKAYDGDLNTALAEMNRWFGGTGTSGAERAADCMARGLGATWTHYTPCDNPSWRAGARRLLARERL